MIEAFEVMQPPPYQLMPDLSAEEFSELKKDIRQRGVLVPIEFDGAGNILDGHHRMRAFEELQAEGCEIADYPHVVREGLTEEQKRQHVRSLNVQRRHLTREQRRELIAEQLRETPERSNRLIAEALGVSHPTVATVREEMESGGKIYHLDKTVGADGKTYPSTRQTHAELNPPCDETEDIHLPQSSFGREETTAQVRLSPEIEQAIVKSTLASMITREMREHPLEVDSPIDNGLPATQPSTNSDFTPPPRVNTAYWRERAEKERKAEAVAMCIEDLANPPLTGPEFKQFAVANTLNTVRGLIPRVRALLNEIEQVAL